MNKKQLALIHIAKKQVDMTETEYRDLLGSVNAVSSKDLDGKSFSIVMNHFAQLGFKSTSTYRPENGLPQGKQVYLRKIDAILDDLDLKRDYADRLAKNRFGVEKVHWLDPRKIRKVMQMLIYHQKRQQANPVNKGA